MAAPHPVVDTAVPATTGAPEAAFVFVAITLPALVAAGAGLIGHALGRNR
ncbi:hypothetical protein ACFQZC_30170 [Streptacidiphilus monticola]